MSYNKAFEGTNRQEKTNFFFCLILGFFLLLKFSVLRLNFSWIHKWGKKVIIPVQVMKKRKQKQPFSQTIGFVLRRAFKRCSPEALNVMRFDTMYKIYEPVLQTSPDFERLWTADIWRVGMNPDSTSLYTSVSKKC